MNPLRMLIGTLTTMIPALSRAPAAPRSAAEQHQLDEETARLALYLFHSCPFCVRVLRAIRRHGLNIELRDVRSVPAHLDELTRGGGIYQVPCLRIDQSNGEVEWMYESGDIVAYLARISHRVS